MTADCIHARLDELARDGSLEAPDRWRSRAEVLDWLERLFPVLEGAGAGDAAARAQALRARVERADAALYRRLRAAIRGGHGPALFRRWQQEDPGPIEGEGYDALDELLAGVLRLEDPGSGSLPLEPEMVFYQPTPARHVLDMLARGRPGPRDVLVDLGSGLGHVPMLASICTGARAVGVEWQPSHVQVARRAARALGLHDVRFLARDARDADLSAGTVFFLYTPFAGSVLRTVLDALRDEGMRRPIKVCTFGPCTRFVAGEAWLRAVGPTRADRVAVFHSAGLRSD
ncbi:hypothetical protein [Frateuria soli]|uniref:hypothetical protein n=1 Tax=Frateuria soli TaxID=1542730 RepID=UPI001E651862|nr:hypothetical protein [Frateuria soli]UGB36815.1 hypothetical protein LQ771_08140 [Frateuria soli]